ncbi:SLATT domain-containing protein [Nocardia sp. NPDC052112]|uniref:SLATT domain-containing protein n=1 Tax=Nocardia sp. NPDC052112 TaxID=3155646 RepID=UPI003448FF95
MSADIDSYLEKLLDDAVERHNKRKNRLKNASWFLHISAMILGGTSTVLLGLQIDSDTYATVSRNAALIIVALTTIIGALLAYWNLDEYWLKRKVIYNDLVALREKYRYLTASNPKNKRALQNEIFESYMRLVGSHGEYWEAMLAKQADDSTAHERRDLVSNTPKEEGEET